MVSEQMGIGKYTYTARLPYVFRVDLLFIIRMGVSLFLLKSLSVELYSFALREKFFRFLVLN